MRKESSEQFSFDYRPVIVIYALYCLWQGTAWSIDPGERYSAESFATMTRWTDVLDLPPQAWGIPMFISGGLILVGMFFKLWRVRWFGYAIASLTFLTVAESIRLSGVEFPNAQQTGLRNYVFVGVLPIVLAVVSQVHAKERREQRGSP